MYASDKRLKDGLILYINCVFMVILYSMCGGLLYFVEIVYFQFFRIAADATNIPEGQALA